jgi:hypothetical protein
MFTSTNETLVSLALAALVMCGLLLLAATVAFGDVDRIKDKVEKFFQVDLDARELLVREAEYARESARKLENDLIQSDNSGPFSTLPEQTTQPSLSTLEPRALSPGASAKPEKIPLDLVPQAAPSYAMDEMQAGNATADRFLPVISLKQVKSPAGLAPPALAKMYATGQLGGGLLGRPGETVFTPEPARQPDAPSSRSLSPEAPPKTSPLAEETVATRKGLLDDAGPNQQYPSLDKDIDAEFKVYQTPGDQYAYFRLTLSLKPGSPVKTIPKDVLFLVDVSQSISPNELQAVREAVSSSLAALAPHDRWNVAVFSEETHTLHPDFVQPAAFDLEQVRAFIDRRFDERRTDVFRATQAILSGIPASHRPCNVFLVTDGKATSGTSDVQQLMHGFQRMKRDNFSIFTFNGGAGGDLYLLRLLSYRSRGFLANCPENSHISATLREFAATYDQPVLTDVVANYTNILTEEVHPEVLPNLYRSHPVTFWGRTTPGREVALRLAGRGAGGLREFFFRTTVPAGDATQPEVARQWARGKANALIAELADDENNAELKTRILDLAKKHGLQEIQELLEPKGFRLPLPWKQ